MATGDTQDVVKRLRGAIPTTWFRDDAPVLDALLHGLSSIWVHGYDLYQFSKKQTRIRTATEGYLDLISSDFFGEDLPRKQNQRDESYRARIIANLFRERGTRTAINRVVLELTGSLPNIIEPERPLDTGAYRAPVNGYGVAGAYGSILLPYQAFVTVKRASGQGIPNIAGYRISTGGYGEASQAAYADSKIVATEIRDEDIFAAINSVRPAGTIVWVRFAATPGRLDFDFILGVTAIA